MSFKQNLLLITILILFTYKYSISNQQIILNKIIASINNEIVLESELENDISIYLMISNNKESLRFNKSLRKDILMELITRKLQLNIAEKEKIIIKEEYIEYVFNKIIKKFQNNKNNYFSKEKTIANNIKKFIKDNLIIKELQQNLFNRRMLILNKEVEDFVTSIEYKNEIASSSLVDIEIFNKKNISNDHLHKMFKTLNNENDFKKIFKKLKNKNNINIKLKKNNEEYEIINQNNIIGPIFYKNKIHIFKIIKKQSISHYLLNVDIKHIIIKNKPSILKNNKKIKEKLDELKFNILNKSKFKKETKFSEENFKKNYNIKKINKNNVSKKIYNMIENMSIGEISYPFKSEIGWHLIKIIDKKYECKKYTQKMIFNKLKLITLDNKINKTKDLWIKLICDESIIKIYEY